MLPGYVASVTGDAVFVRFLSHVTGRAGLSQLADTLVSDPKRRYAEGQSVRAQVVQVRGASGVEVGWRLERLDAGRQRNGGGQDMFGDVQELAAPLVSERGLISLTHAFMDYRSA